MSFRAASSSLRRFLISLRLTDDTSLQYRIHPRRFPFRAHFTVAGKTFVTIREVYRGLGVGFHLKCKEVIVI
jgi:hypothetical protein